LFRTAALVALLCLLFASPLLADDSQYTLGPDSKRTEGVPQGKITKHQFNQSKIFPGTRRDYYIYVPSQYDETKPTAVMVFQDGHAYVNETGQFRVPIVFDNLIHQGDMPVTIGIFINPGHRGNSELESPWKSNNRGIEYNTLNDDYARFLLEEILPEVSKTYNLSTRAEDRATGGISSGGICAFTVAWEHPEEFSKVLSHVGSFTNINGGNAYPSLIRKTERKPIRVFLQDGEDDLDNQFGNWWLSNLEMDKALAFSGYDYKFVGGVGGHNGIHGGAILPDSLRWLWRKEK